MIPDRLQYFLDDFWNFENFVNIWTRNPPNYYQHALNNTRKVWKLLGTYYLCKSGTHKNDIFDGGKTHGHHNCVDNAIKGFIKIMISIKNESYK